MSFRQGIVVDTHPEDHSVDLVMMDDGSRLVGVQVMSMTASTRTGTIDLPAVPAKKDKWDITRRTGQDMIALVGYIGRNPVVTGFLYPQVNQVLPKDKQLRYSRHQSDVEWFIDGEGNIQLNHPGGAYVRIGEAADKVDLAGKNADANSATDRNTSRKVNVRVGLAGNVVILTMTPEGSVSFKLEKDFSIEAEGNVSVDAKGTAHVKSVGNATVETQGVALIKSPTEVRLETPLTHCTQNLMVDGLLTYKGGLVGSGGSGAQVTGNLNLNGNLEVTQGVQIGQNLTVGQNISAGGTITDSDGDGGA